MTDEEREALAGNEKTMKCDIDIRKNLYDQLFPVPEPPLSETTSQPAPPPKTE
ncbi:hypothetical protein [Pandoraea faecigallinarum]|uniref:hypothetical protein n=1 Tax=Pandoraea faecigallinarum TaxID=656179 RepID=UPI000A46AED0|nr:hypothetical protein [Pandoraea faecigallinarum]